MHEAAQTVPGIISPASIKQDTDIGRETLQQTVYLDSLKYFPIQRKLSIGAVDDPLEHEADAMADHVMRMPQTSFIQRKCAHCEDEEKVQRKQLENRRDFMAKNVMHLPGTSFIQRKCAHCEDEEKIQRKPVASFIQKKGASINNNSVASDSISNQIQSTKGNGTFLSGSTKSFMETRFGADFSNVNIHTDNNATQLSTDLNAQAFTVGNDIYFNDGQYQPGSSSGKQLLAHELTHVIQQKGSYSSLMRYPCPTGSCHGEYGHEGYYRRLHPFPPDPIIPDPFPFPTPVPVPPAPVPAPVPPTPVPVQPAPVPVTPVINEDKLAEEIRNKIFKKVVVARDDGIPYLPERVPYPFKQDAFWRLNIMIGLNAEGSIILSIKRYIAEKDAYVEILFQQMRKKIEDIEKSGKKDDKDGKDDKDHKDHKDHKDLKDHKDHKDHKDDKNDKDDKDDKDDKNKQRDKDKPEDKDCGRFDIGCKVDKIVNTIEDLVDTAKTVDEFFGIADLFNLPGEIRALPEFIDLYDQMKLFWQFKDHIGEFEKWITEPQFLLRALIGIESSPLLDTFQDWVDSGSDKPVKIDKGAEIYGLAQRVKNLLAKIRSLLRPIFAIRKRMLTLVGEIQGLVMQVPAAESIIHLISIAGNPDELKDAGKELVADTISEFAADVSYLIRSKIEGVIQTLELPVLKFVADDFIDNGMIARAITKVATRLIPGVEGKILRTEPGKFVISHLVETLLNGIESEAFDVINDKLSGFNKLLVGQFDGALASFESKMTEFIVPKINEKIFGKEVSKDVKVSRSAVDDKAIEDTGRLQMLPSMLQQSSGEQINSPALNKMESLLHSDFNDVRIHRDTTAEQAAGMLRANAFTIGPDIYFGKGKYDPNVADGQKLLAHELTHVAQQKQGKGAGIVQRSLLDKFGEGVIDAISILHFTPLPETGFVNPKNKKPIRQKDRSYLRRNMTDPPWAVPALQYRGWNAHHVIPWEFLRHPVFDVLRTNGGWDHNDARNGIALPTQTGIPGAEKLTVHQFRRFLLRGHPVYNGKVEQGLKQLEQYESDPVRLRQEVYRLIDYLKTNELVASKMPVLT